MPIPQGAFRKCEFLALTPCQVIQPQSLDQLVPMEGVEPTHPYGYQILSLARLPIPPHRLFDEQEYKSEPTKVNR